VRHEIAEVVCAQVNKSTLTVDRGPSVARRVGSKAAVCVTECTRYSSTRNVGHSAKCVSAKLELCGFRA
jgi:hypothetical protein